METCQISIVSILQDQRNFWRLCDSVNTLTNASFALNNGAREMAQRLEPTVFRKKNSFFKIVIVYM